MFDQELFIFIYNAIVSRKMGRKLFSVVDKAAISVYFIVKFSFSYNLKQNSSANVKLC